MESIDLLTDVALERHTKNMQNFGQYKVLDDGAGQARYRRRINNGSIWSALTHQVAIALNYTLEENLAISDIAKTLTMCIPLCGESDYFQYIWYRIFR